MVMKKGIRYWSPTGLETFLRCPRQFYLRRFFRKKETAPALAKGTFLHRRISLLREGRRKFKSAESWGNSCVGDWKRFVCKTNSIRGDKILWKDEGQKWIIANEIRQVCNDHFDRLMEEDVPVLFPSGKRKTPEYGFQVIFEGKGFRGEIDEVRPNRRLRDYKSGGWWKIEKGKEFHFQPTFYLFIYAMTAHFDEKFRKKVGVGEKQAKKWAGNPEYISEDLDFEYFMLERDKKWNSQTEKYVFLNRDPVIETKRSDFDYGRLCEVIDDVNARANRMEDRNEYVLNTGTHCNWCDYRKECDDISKNRRKRLIQVGLFDEVKMLPSESKIEIQQLKLKFGKRKS